MTKESYNQHLHNSITKSYKKTTTNLSDTINKDGIELSNKKGVLKNINKNGKDECFISLKDHKDNFQNNPSTRLINPAKNEIGRISKVIVEEINKKLRSTLQLQQWKDTSDVIDWFNNIEQKQVHKFMIFDIKDFYPSITSTLLNNAISFAKQYVNICNDDLRIIHHSRKSLLYNNGEEWIKKGNELFDVTMGAYDGAEICELVGLFLLNEISKSYKKEQVGLYRDDGLTVFKNINGHEADKIRKHFHQIFKSHGLLLEIECNLKITNFLDITLNLNDGT